MSRSADRETTKHLRAESHVFSQWHGPHQWFGKGGTQSYSDEGWLDGVGEDYVRAKRNFLGLPLPVFSGSVGCS